jgi:hypothetical protein
LSSRELDEPLPFLDRLALKCHVAVCRSCRRFRVQIRLIRKALRRREEIQIEPQTAEGQLSSEARARIALACARVGFDDACAHGSAE